MVEGSTTQLNVYSYIHESLLLLQHGFHIFFLCQLETQVAEVLIISFFRYVTIDE